MLIGAIYRRSLVMTGKARVAIPSSRLVNHISTDVSRIDFCLGFFHMAWTAPVQFVVIVCVYGSCPIALTLAASSSVDHCHCLC